MDELYIALLKSHWENENAFLVALAHIKFLASYRCDY